MPAVADNVAVRIEGLREFQRGLKQLGPDLPKALRMALNDAADVVVADARPRVPRRTGRAQRSVKAQSTQTSARVVGGGTRAKHYPFLDFGGRVGRNRSVRRPFLPKGRYIYNAYFKAKASGEFEKALQRGLVKVAGQAGIEVS